ncbi:MAG: cation:proton antiporter [Lamprobacter sp.]|uniref:cation:proton antiporter domain-containing protein n=1 Tax=Lamprobacter sp. TaxID=3100796 RepID=UPI002B25D3BE|nr:cation:proton antiporter [Lamprobacter sp.]MEA3640829.1 cation:proton antiporter [Lamprobacter sp.]
MDPEAFVQSSVLLLLAAAAAVTLFKHFGLGSILGLLVAGVLIGPYTPGPSVTGNVDDLRHFTELGVVLLLFVIGLELHPSRLWEMRRTLFGLGTSQIILSGLALALYFRLFVETWPIALLIGLSLALSSTALVMQMLYDKGEIATPRGQTAFAVLLMQDIAVVPMLALLPLAAASGASLPGPPLWEQLGLILLMLLGVIVSGRYLVPLVLDLLARQGNREAFFLVTLASVFVAAWAMNRAGMSMALGGFLMGMMLSGSRYSVQVHASIEPHKGLLMSVFFVTVGMSLDLNLLSSHPLLFSFHLLVLVAIKVGLIYLLAQRFCSSRASALQVAFMLGQAGEFGFILFGAAKMLGIIDVGTFTMAVALISGSMLITPLLVRLGAFLAARFPSAEPQVDERFRYEPSQGHAQEQAPQVVIAGYGRVGHTIGTVLASHGIRFVAFDQDPGLVARWRAEGQPVFYGDIRNPALLAAAKVEQAKLVVLTIDDPGASIEATTLVRHYAPEIIIVARARDLTACDALFRAGASRAFPEAVEASLRLAAETLDGLGITDEDAEQMVQQARGKDYALVRSEITEQPPMADPAPPKGS